MQTRHFEVVIIGAGTAGVSVASRLNNSRIFRSVALVDPAKKHYYQPLWTLVGAGTTTFQATERAMSDVIPEGVEWVQEPVLSFEPEARQVILPNGILSYDFLVVAPGIQIDWQKVQGLQESLGKNGVCSNYAAWMVPYTWQSIKDCAPGQALFTFPSTPIKCAGAPQKIMYLADDHFQRTGKRSAISVGFRSAAANIFGVQKYREALEKIIIKRGIQTSYQTDLIAVDGPAKKATFRNLKTGEESYEDFSMLHVAPPMSAPDFVKSSPLTNDTGWVDVDKHTLQHNRYSNIFSLGDASSLPTSKTGAAVRKQAPVLVKNLVALKRGQPLIAKYDGYTSCPLVTGYGKLILAEFDYDAQPVETFPFDQSKERLSMYLLKKHMLPQLYWHGMLKGLA